MPKGLRQKSAPKVTTAPDIQLRDARRDAARASGNKRHANAVRRREGVVDPHGAIRKAVAPHDADMGIAVELHARWEIDIGDAGDGGGRPVITPAAVER